MFFEQPRRNVQGLPAAAPPTTLGDIWNSTISSSWYVDNIGAAQRAIDEAYERRIAGIKAATGVDLVNPMRRGGSVPPEDGSPAPDIHAEFQAELMRLAGQFPDQRLTILGNKTVVQDGEEIAGRVGRHADAVMDAYRGPWGTGTAMNFVANVAGSFTDPVNGLSNFAGPVGRVGVGLKNLLWMAVKQGVANAAIETAFQPVVQDWRRRAGLEFGVSHAAMNIAAAGAGGALLDFGVRGGARLVNRRVRGLEPEFDGDGGVKAWRRPEDLLEAAARADRDGVPGLAATGDTIAVKQMLREAGLAEHPAVRSAIERLDDAAATFSRSRGVDPHDHDARVVQFHRSLDDPREPPPLPPEPVAFARGPSLADDAVLPVGVIAIDGRPVVRQPANADGHGRAVVFEATDGVRQEIIPGRLTDAAEAIVLRAADGWDAAAAAVVALRKELQDGRMGAVDAAKVLRAEPSVMDATISLASAEMQAARAMARLSEPAFAGVLDGSVEPRLARLVGDLVEDRAEHAGVLRQLGEVAPRSDAEARHAIAILMQRLPPVRSIEGVDDPLGADGLRQTEILRQTLADRIQRASDSQRLPEIGDDIDGVSLARALADVADMKRAKDVLEACKA